MTPVVIVGAGPCGLAAACALRQQGIGVRLLDSAAGPGPGSRAVLLWPPALEVLRAVGVADQARQEGLPVKALTYHLTGGRRLRSELGSANAALLLPQQHTTRLLAERFAALGGRIEWSTQVSEVHTVRETVVVRAGTTLVEADWLIAADGVRSTVRDLLGIEFPGAAVPGRYLITEAAIDGDLEIGAVHYFLRPAGSLVIAPMRGGRTRISGPVAEDTPLTPETVRLLVDERGPAGLGIRELGPVTSFSSQERVASALRQGRCFLVGDAAHTHSPIGGQGLNLGLQDVHNLAWKLGGVITGRLTPAVLDTYDTERRQAATQVLGNTRRALRMFLLGPVGARVRNTAWRALESTGALRTWFTPLLAGRRARYTAGTDRRHWLLPAEGTRAPHWLPDPPLGPPTFRLITVGSRLTRPAEELAHRRSLPHQRVNSRFRTGFVLVRPDGFIARSGVTRSELDSVAELAC
jgi:2-polyprenyl-6-methoxyphenol hydroxylase-like FAD-dependent oxidoreductase